MSHIINTECRVMDLADLEAAAPLLGLEFRRGQTTHRWYGHFVGDTTPPAGLSPKDYGTCLHALALKGDPSAYEIGVVKALDGGPGYDLVCDTWQQHKLLAAVGGSQLNRLRQEVSVAAHLRVAKAKLARRGFSVRRENLPNGRVSVRLVRR